MKKKVFIFVLFLFFTLSLIGGKTKEKLSFNIDDYKIKVTTILDNGELTSDDMEFLDKTTNANWDIIANHKYNSTKELDDILAVEELSRKLDAEKIKDKGYRDIILNLLNEF